MPVFFTSGGVENRGRVVALGQGIPGSVAMSLERWQGFQGFKAIFLKASINEQVNAQFLHTIGNNIYAYVFGDRLGTFALSGMAFYDNCTNDSRLGISHVIDYYRTYRMSRRIAPLKITLQKDSVFRCYLLAMSGDTVAPDQNIFQFNLQFALVPDSPSAARSSASNSTTLTAEEGEGGETSLAGNSGNSKDVTLTGSNGPQISSSNPGSAHTPVF